MFIHNTHKQQAMVFGPLNYCMYGPDHDKSQLTREHIVPRSLGGGIIARAATCEDCRIKTGHFENECTRKNWHLFRTAIDLEISDQDRAPTHGVVTAFEYGHKLPLIVPLKDFPLVLTMPKIADAPGLFTGKLTCGRMGLVHIFDPNDAAARAARRGLQFASVEGIFNARAVLQLLAKIAHGMMFVNFKMEHIEPLLLEIIVDGNLENAWRVIGATAPISVPIDHRFIGVGHHQIRCDVQQNQFGQIYVIVDICLFPTIPRAILPVPTYRMIAGRASQVPKKRIWRGLICEDI